jgi:hypothetical protein
MFVDPAIQLVDIHGVDAVLQPVVLDLQTGYGGIVLSLLVGMALAEGRTDPGQHFLWEGVGDHFLAYNGLRAFPLVSRAVVIDIPPLLDLADHRAAAMAAADEAGKGEVLLRLAGPLTVATIEHPLDAFPQLADDDSRSSGMAGISPSWPLRQEPSRCGPTNHPA